MFDFINTCNTDNITNKWNELVISLKFCNSSIEITNLLELFKIEFSKFEDINNTVKIFKTLLMNSDYEQTQKIFEYVKSHKNILMFDDHILNVRRYFINYHEINDIGVFIGRCQIFHKGHEETFFEILQSCEKMIFILGSDFEISERNIPEKINIMDFFERTNIESTTLIQHRTKQNPFTTSERIQISLSFLNDTLLNRIYFAPMVDLNNELLWIDTIINGINIFLTSNVGLFGYVKDSSSYYLQLFPTFILRIKSEPYFSENILNPLSSTTIRQELFTTNTIKNMYVSENVKNIVTKIWNDLDENTKEKLKN